MKHHALTRLVQRVLHLFSQVKVRFIHGDAKSDLFLKARPVERLQAWTTGALWKSDLWSISCNQKVPRQNFKKALDEWAQGLQVLAHSLYWHTKASRSSQIVSRAGISCQQPSNTFKLSSNSSSARAKSTHTTDWLDLYLPGICLGLTTSCNLTSRLPVICLAGKTPSVS